MTLAVLAAYRGRGVGSQLFRTVLDHCSGQGIHSIYLHVHISNEDAIRFYTDRFGFEQGELLMNYYRRLSPPHCYLLSKTLQSTLPSVPDCPPITTNDSEQQESSKKHREEKDEESLRSSLLKSVAKIESRKT